MFTTGEYKIVFKRRWHQPRGKVAEITEVLKHCSDGRYDTVCEITHVECVLPYTTMVFTGIAKLHPSDRPDRIVGKKIALRNAIGIWDDINEEWSYSCAEFFNKEVRTAIWKAFAEWVLSWRLPKTWELYEDGTPSERKEMIAEIRRLHKTTVWQPPKAK